jgi:DNA-binding LacI/PurR family transcriptional regulator
MTCGSGEQRRRQRGRMSAIEGMDTRTNGSVSTALPRRRGRSGSGRVTISDIAQEARVSKTAVSFAFNMPGRLSKQTTEHILAVARRMGYTPNPIARSLNTRRTNAIGLIVPQDIPDVLRNPFFAELMRGVGEVCKRGGFSLMLIPPMRGSLVDATYAALVDGCLVIGLEYDDPVVKALSQRRIPYVMVDTDAPAHIASVNVDDCTGARMAMKHLLDLGHRRIAVVSLESHGTRFEDYHGVLRRRMNGYAAALADYGLTLRSPGISVHECEPSVEGGRRAFHQLRAHAQPPTAAAVLSDAIAWGLIEAARMDGVQIPRDLAIVGFDDLPASHLMQPALTTVRQSAVEKGRRAAELFLELLRTDGMCDPQHVMLPVELVVRDSSA